VALAKAAGIIFKKEKSKDNKKKDEDKGVIEDISTNMIEREIRNGYKMLLNACFQPFKQIIINGGMLEEAVVLNEVMKEDGPYNGFDARTGKSVKDMIKAGIIDPLKVTRTALESAVSVASILLTTEAAIVDKPEKEHNHGGQMPGMGQMM
jgi:chaperonin GroEL